MSNPNECGRDMTWTLLRVISPGFAKERRRWSDAWRRKSNALFPPDHYGCTRTQLNIVIFSSRQTTNVSPSDFPIDLMSICSSISPCKVACNHSKHLDRLNSMIPGVRSRESSLYSRGRCGTYEDISGSCFTSFIWLYIHLWVRVYKYRCEWTRTQRWFTKPNSIAG